jgi:hypothetical protein
MTIKMRLPFSMRGRRRLARRDDDPAEVFRTFVQLLAQMRAQARSGAATGRQS